MLYLILRPNWTQNLHRSNQTMCGVRTGQDAPIPAASLARATRFPSGHRTTIDLVRRLHCTVRVDRTMTGRGLHRNVVSAFETITRSGSDSM